MDLVQLNTPREKSKQVQDMYPPIPDHTMCSYLHSYSFYFLLLLHSYPDTIPKWWGKAFSLLDKPFLYRNWCEQDHKQKLTFIWKQRCSSRFSADSSRESLGLKLKLKTAVLHSWSFSCRRKLSGTGKCISWDCINYCGVSPVQKSYEQDASVTF